MKLSLFDYKYPKDLIAQRPLEKRDSSRMLVADRKTKTVQHSHIRDLPDFLKEGDLIIFNDSKVIPARLFGRRGNGAEVELLVIEPVPSPESRVPSPGCTWRCLLKKAKLVKAGENFFFGMHAKAQAVGREGIFLLVEFKGKALSLAMKYHGVPPLPPYIERNGIHAYSDEDKDRYQTVFAKTPGSAAAPTAGLHFSEELLGRIKKKGVDIEHITLHVGIDTFAPLRTDDITTHKMHGERFEISQSAASKIADAKKAGRRVIAVGTTTTRALESAALGDGPISAGSFTTDLFIKPHYEFKVVGAMITNFHQPKSSLIVLVSAFAGREFILHCYEDAIKNRYRLFSYGDSMLII